MGSPRSCPRAGSLPPSDPSPRVTSPVPTPAQADTGHQWCGSRQSPCQRRRRPRFPGMATALKWPAATSPGAFTTPDKSAQVNRTASAPVPAHACASYEAPDLEQSVGPGRLTSAARRDARLSSTTLHQIVCLYGAGGRDGGSIALVRSAGLRDLWTRREGDSSADRPFTGTLAASCAIFSIVVDAHWRGATSGSARTRIRRGDLTV